MKSRLTINVGSETTTVDFVLTPKRVPIPRFPAPIAEYPFDGSLRDLIGNGPEARLFEVEWGPDRLERPSSALGFNGSSSYASLGNSFNKVFSAPVAKFTIFGWARTDSYPEHQGGGCIIAKAAGGARGPYQWSLNHDPDGKLKALVASKSDGGALLIKESNPIPTGQWFCFALTFDGSCSESDRVQLYVNGVPGSFSRRRAFVGVRTEPTDQEITLGATPQGGLSRMSR